jgi:arylsulfatase A-like enzyme
MRGREAGGAPALTLLLLLLTALGSGCGPARSRPSFVLILVDTLRADHLGAYGYRRPTSPRLDALAARGTLFETAITQAPWTLPAAMAVVTGRLPSSHRVENDGLRLSRSIPTLAEILKREGYSTSAVVSHIYVAAPFGFDRGFDHFDDFGLSRAYRFEAGLEPRAEAVTDHALAQVRALKGRPFFLLAHYFDPHWDYDPPAPYAERFARPYSGKIDGRYQSFSRFAPIGVELPAADREHLIDLYDGEIAYTDAQIGRLLDGLRGAGVSEAVVAITADHGEEFKEHGGLGHGRTLYDEVLRVPLIVSRIGAAGPAGRVPEQVRSIDLFPTICELAGAAIPSGVQGKSLVPWLEGRKDASRGALSETIRFDAYRKSYREAGRKVIVRLEDNRREFYDLVADPGETRNVLSERAPEALRLEEALFSETEGLAGGWNLRWSSDGSAHRFSGTIETDGLILSLVPLFPEPGRHRIVRGRRIDFDLEGVVRGGGLSFSVEPDDARVNFSLALDGSPGIGFVRIGGERTLPPSNPFSLSSPLRSDVMARPVFTPGGETGYFLWRSPSGSPSDAVELSDAMKERLRSLGYLR